MPILSVSLAWNTLKKNTKVQKLYENIDH